MRARGRGMTWWARTAQKSGSRLLPNAAVPVWLSSALRTSVRERTHCRPPSLNIEASTLAAISGLRRRDTMPEMAVSGADPFRKRPD